MEDGNITFTPKSLVDRHVAEGLEDARKGGAHGAYGSAEDAVAALESRAKGCANKRRTWSFGVWRGRTKGMPACRLRSARRSANKWGSCRAMLGIRRCTRNKMAKRLVFFGLPFLFDFLSLLRHFASQ